MKKVNATYSARHRRKPAAGAKPAKTQGLRLPRWTGYAAAIGMAIALCLTVNFRAYTDLNREVEQNETLSAEIEKVTNDNLNLQEEIYYLQNDSKTIEREARKFGFRREKEKQVPVTADK